MVRGVREGEDTVEETMGVDTVLEIGRVEKRVSISEAELDVDAIGKEHEIS